VSINDTRIKSSIPDHIACVELSAPEIVCKSAAKMLLQIVSERSTWRDGPA
jgi:hypothetical protein